MVTCLIDFGDFLACAASSAYLVMVGAVFELR